MVATVNDEWGALVLPRCRVPGFRTGKRPRFSGSSASTPAMVSAALRTQIRALGPHAVLRSGPPGTSSRLNCPASAWLPHPALLPATKPPASKSHLALLVHAGDVDAVKDRPMLNPRQTIARSPRLSMISYG
jgi:hypothetical protein